MKKYSILLSCILFCSCVGYGQIKSDSTLTFILSGHEEIQSKLDTVKVFYLMSDTSNYSGQKLMGNWSVYGQSGYEVKECQYMCCNPSNQMDAEYYWNCGHLKYLDYDKNILPKNIVIWQAKYY